MIPRNILVTGGFGYVGSRLTPHLLELGHRVRVLDAMLYTHAGMAALEKHPRFAEFRPRFELVEGDLRDPQTVERAVAGMDTVIHLAAISNDPTGDIDEVLTRQVNFDAVGMLLAMARPAGVQRFINASSSSVFGIKNDPDVTERLEPEPLTFYSKCKMLSEWLVTAANSAGFCTVTSGRPPSAATRHASDSTSRSTSSRRMPCASASSPCMAESSVVPTSASPTRSTSTRN